MVNKNLSDHPPSETSLEMAVIPSRPRTDYSRRNNALSVEYDLFSFNKKTNQNDRIIFSLLGALVLILFLFIIHLFILKPLIISTNSISDRFTDDSWIHMDQIIRKNVGYIRHKNANTSDDDDSLILMSTDLKWLNHLQLNSANVSFCYKQDDLSLFYHYCVDESQYPIIYDQDCWPHSIDLYQQLLMTRNQTNLAKLDTSVIDEFVQIYHRFLNNSDGLKSIKNEQLSLAFSYAKKIGRDCEHSELWQQNFNLSLPSGRNEKEMWELYCLRHIRYPNIVSINTGKYYVPEYYLQLIESDSNGKRSLASDEKWMYRWMVEKFIPLYRSNLVLQKRFENESKNSIIFAKKNGLEC